MFICNAAHWSIAGLCSFYIYVQYDSANIRIASTRIDLCASWHIVYMTIGIQAVSRRNYCPAIDVDQVVFVDSSSSSPSSSRNHLVMYRHQTTQTPSSHRTPKHFAPFPTRLQSAQYMLPIWVVWNEALNYLPAFNIAHQLRQVFDLRRAQLPS